ncbi:MAG: HAMP domain-containing sensor histidine kinase [Pseudomonadota bacterium]
MSRLFWKLFGLLWLAHVLPPLVVGATAWHLQFRETGFPTPPVLALGPLPPLPVPVYLFVLGSLGTVALSVFLAWRFSRPIKALNTEFTALAQDPMRERPVAIFAERRDELADLGGAFHRMAERLRELIVGQKRLLHSVSHELRSPLSRIQAASDLLLQQPERRAELANRISADVARMDHLVSDLLKIARLESGLQPSRVSAFRLKDAIGDVVDRVLFSASTLHCDVAVRVPTGQVVHSDATLFGHAFENVLENAVRHAPLGSTVDIEVSENTAAGTVDIAVIDGGPGVTGENVDRIFEPFFRERPASGDDGYGLGLPLTRRIAEALGGAASAANRSEGGLKVTLSLPVAPHGAVQHA